MSGGEGVQVEARTLSGGEWVSGLLAWPCEVTTAEPDNDFAGHVIVGLRRPWLPRREQHCVTSMPPTDLVTLTGGGAS
jgi:hypothetical protein